MSENIAHWGQLFAFYVKRDWKRIVLWLVLLGGFAGGFVPAFETISEEQGLVAMYEVMQNPAMTAIVGDTPIETVDNYTLGAMYSHLMLLFTSLFSMIVSMLHVISRTRNEEDQGITEYISAFKIGRQANSFAVTVETVLINLLLAVITGLLMIGFNVEGITVQGSFLLGASVATAGIIGAMIALVMAQIFPSSSGATGASIGIAGILYIVRAGTDIINVDLSVFNPLGWTYLTYPFAENNWLLLLYALIFSLAVFGLAFMLEGGRDMGTGYLPENQGRENARKSLLSVPGLFIRLNRGIIASWMLLFIFMGLSYGAIYGEIQTFVESNELLRQMFVQGGTTIEESFTGMITMVIVTLVSILPIVIINKVFTEEKKLHLNQLFSTKVTRTIIYWTNILLAILAGVIGIGISSGLLGITAISVMEEGNSVIGLNEFLAIGYNQLPGLLFIVGIAALFLGWAPRLNMMTYVYLGYTFLINYFGNIIDFPEWVTNIAIQDWIPRMPIEEFDGNIFLIITMISLTMMVIGAIGYNRRDLIEEG